MLTFTATPLDRAVNLRGDDAQLRALQESGAARFVPVWSEKFPVNDARIVTLSAQAAMRWDQSNAVFLGLAGDVPWFALALPASEQAPALGGPESFLGLRDLAAVLEGDEAAIAAYALAMTIWRANHLHCGRCGAATVATEGGHSSTCSNAACAHRTFPRSDPVVITLITAGDKCLLGRQAAWPPGMYSCIAGFVEPGETLESAVRREAREETGLSIGEVRYVASQPWPFPASLMQGFRAEALTTELHPDGKELEDCRWFTKAEVRGFKERDSEGDGFKLPSRYAIARLLVEGWLAE